MLKRTLLLFCTALLATTTVYAQRDIKEEDWSGNPYEYGRNTEYMLSFHDISLSYGFLTMNDITDIMKELFQYSLAAAPTNGFMRTGSMNLGYTYRLTPSITVGGLFGYSGNSGSIEGTASKVVTNYYSLMPQMKLEWYRKKAWTLYSRLALGVVIANATHQTGTAIDNSITAATFTFQVSPIGVELGRTIAAFAEAGFGATGVLTIGVRTRF